MKTKSGFQSLANLALLAGIVLAEPALACFSNVPVDLVKTQYGAQVGPITAPAVCSFTPPAEATNIAGTGGGTALGTTTTDARVATFDLDWTGGSSGTNWGGTAFIYIPDLIFSDPDNPAATSALVGAGELALLTSFDATVNEPNYNGLSNGTRYAYLTDLTGGKFFETAFNGFQYGTGFQQFSDDVNPIYSNPASLPLNTAVGLYVHFGTDHSAGGAAPSSSDLVATLGGTMLFSLPEGLTVNSASLGLVDNVFAASVVPVPAAVWLFGSAIAFLAGLRRRISRHATGGDSARLFPGAQARQMAA